MTGTEYIAETAPTPEKKLALVIAEYRRHQNEIDGSNDELMSLLERISRLDDPGQKLWRLPEDSL